MIEVSIYHYLILSSMIFTIGLFGIFLNRKNLIIILMSLELILLSVNINFVAFSSLLLFMFVDNLEIMKVITSVLALLFVLNNIKPELFRMVPSPIAFISGFYNDRYSAVDHFPILPWIFLICIGVFIGHYLLKNEINSPKFITNNPVSDVLKTIGKRSLEIYAVHWLVLYLIYCHLYPKYFRKI